MVRFCPTHEDRRRLLRRISNLQVASISEYTHVGSRWKVAYNAIATAKVDISLVVCVFGKSQVTTTTPNDILDYRRCRRLAPHFPPMITLHGYPDRQLYCDLSIDISLKRRRAAIHSSDFGRHCRDNGLRQLSPLAAQWSRHQKVGSPETEQD